MDEKNRLMLRSLVRSFYAEQKLRIQVGNRIVANVRATLGAAPGTKTEDMPEEGKLLLKNLTAEYRRVTDALADKNVRKRLAAVRNSQGVIATPYEYELVGQYVSHLDREKELADAIAFLVEEFPIYSKWLSDVGGCGPIMSAVLISEIDIRKARYVSSLWALAGLDVAPDGKGRSRRKEHLVLRKYIDKNGKEAEKLSITFNPFLKTKLLGVLGPSFLRQKGSPYRAIYENYKHRLENHAVYKDTTKAHRHAMSMRYAVKIFLKDLYVAWKQLEGLPVELPYAEAKLGYRQHGVA